MKNLRALSIIMSTLIVSQSALNPIAFAMLTAPTSAETQNLAVASTEDELKEIIKSDNVEQLDQVLRERNIDVKSFEFENGQTLLHVAAQVDANKVAELLISKGAYINATIDNWSLFRGWTPLYIAARCDAIKVAELLISKGADIKEKIKFGDNIGQTLLHSAAYGDAVKVAELLVSKGADINAEITAAGCDEGKTPLHIATEQDAVKVAELLISKGANINYYRRPMLHYAVGYGALKVAELLISKGADINAKIKNICDNEGMTPLHIAARRNDLKMTELLISKGADINAKIEESYYNKGKTPLHIAAENDSVKVAELLIRKGADINAKIEKDCYDEGKIPLHFAAKEDAVKVAKLLISKGADVNAKDKNGSIPLYYAKREVTRLLLNSVVFETNPNSEEMAERIQESLLQSIFFQPNLISVVKEFLPSNIQEENIPRFCRTPQFFDVLKKNGILKNDSEGEKKESSEIKEKSKREESLHQNTDYIKQTIEEDNLELLQKEAGKENFDWNTKIEDSFFKEKDMRIPILHYCVMKKAIKCFKFLVLNGADPSKKLENKGDSRKYEWDCMSVAICFGEWEMMKILEERGVKKQNNPNVWEAAALTHRNNLLELFISNKDEIDNFEECRNKAMFGIAKGNNIKGLRLLLEQAEDVNVKDEEGRTPLHLAAESDANKVAEMLIRKMADVGARDNKGSSPLHYAAKNDANKVAEVLIWVLINEGKSLNMKDKKGRTPLREAIKNDATKVAELLISKGADVKKYYDYYSDMTPLLYAVISDANKVVELLIHKAEYDINSLLHTAARYGALKVVELLIRKGANINAKDNDGWTPLHTALNSDKGWKVAEMLISKGANVNAKDEWGKTPLQIALNRATPLWDTLGCSTVKIAELLIRKGANVNDVKVDKAKVNDLLFDAAYYDTAKVAKLLLRRGADVNTRVKGGWRNDGSIPLHFAGGWKVAKRLLKYGANIDAKDRCKVTPLHSAAKRGNAEVVDLLIRWGAKVNAKDRWGGTPLDYAKDDRVKEILRSKGAKHGDEMGCEIL